MASTIAAQLLISINGGSTQTGGITIPQGATVQLSSATVSQQYTLFELYGYPIGWAAPTGWSTDPSGTIYFNGLVPPAFTIPAGVWGKWLPRLTIENGKTNGQNDSSRVDASSGFLILSPALSLEEIATQESNQFHRNWVIAYQNAMRSLEAGVGTGVYGGAYAQPADTVSLTLASSGAAQTIPVVHPHGTAQNVSASGGGGVLVSIAGPVSVRASASFVAPAGPTQISFAIYKNGAQIADSVAPNEYASGEKGNPVCETLATAAAGDVFTMGAFTVGASGATTLAVSNARVIVESKGPRQGATGAAGAAGSGASPAGALVSGTLTLPNVNKTFGCDLRTQDSNAPFGAVTPSDGLIFTFDLVIGSNALNLTGANFVTPSSNGGTVTSASFVGAGQTISVKYNAAASVALGVPVWQVL